MDSVAARLPAVLGSLAAMVVAFISLLVQVSPAVCLLRAFAAFAVFSAIGIVVRYLLGDAPQPGRAEDGARAVGLESGGIAPGTPVSDLLAEDERSRAE